METIKSRTAILSKVLRIIYIGVLMAHLLVWGLDVNAQSIKPSLTIEAGTSSRSVHPQISRVREIYTSQIGVREKGSNSGLEVEEYLRYVNLPKGNPWCAAFVCWVYGEAGLANPKTGWSPGLFPAKRVIWERKLKFDSYRAENGKLKAESVGGGIRGVAGPRTGDVFGLYFPEKGRIAHVGFVDEWKGGWVMTVEGNTNVLGSREGDGVYRKRRLVRSVYKVARYVE